MICLRIMRRFISGALMTFSASVFAGGPLVVCYQFPTKYPGAGSVSLNYDQGILGSRTKVQADALVTEAVSLWTNVVTSTVAISRGADLPVDVAGSNYATFLYDFSDGWNPVIYDTNGSIIDSIFGVGAKNSVLGFAGSAWNNNGSQCEYVEGRAVINGYIPVNDTTMKVVLAHEVGHLIGLDHTQLDNSQGLVSSNPSNYPLMYPIAYRSYSSLHEDDISAVSALYPDATLGSVYGQLTGSFTQANGTPIRGANIWAKEVSTNKVFSVVSDYLIQNTGYFKLLLPPGSYTLHAEVIQTEFTASSSIGPYSDTSADLSFQPPLYNNGVAIAPVVFGGSTPTQLVIAAGCVTSAVFKMDGTGSVGGNCGVDNLSPTVPTGLSATPVSSGQINLGWTASTDNVGVTGYKVYRGGALVGSPATASYNDTGLTASTSYSYTLSACDAANNCSAQSNPVSATTMSVTTSSNIALASVGAVASASSTYASGNPVGAVNDNERSGVNWDNGGGWADATANTQPDWVKINFNGTKTIDRVVVYTLQDNYTNPIEPTDTLTFKTWGVTGFTVQGWDGSAWITLATVSGNNLVKRTVSFAAYTTDRIRVNITSALAGYSRITEIEAWGVAASGAAPDTTLPTVPTGLSATPVSSGQINLGWTASTDNVGVTGYKVYRGGALVGSPATASYNDTGLTASTSYSYTLSACDAANNCSAQSNPVSATTMSVTTSSNIALASVGAVASASSTYASGNPVGAVNDNERSGVNWDNGGGWADATANTQPDWVKINFNGTKTIDRVVVYTLQDNYTNPIEPTDTLTFKTWGVTGFTVQGWDGSAWITLATVSGNNLVKRTVSFAAYTTDRIRVNITSALAGYSRITEIEAWGVAASGAAPDTTLPTVPTGLSATPVSSGQINLGWTASTDNVGVTGYKVYRGGALVGSPATASYNDTGLTASTSYSYTLSACDAANNCSAQSNPVSATTMSVTTSSNIALASVGAVASASSTYASGNPVGAVNDNERSGVNWDNGGGWADATANTQPDWVKINFNGTKTIDRVVVYTLQDNYTNPIEPTDTLTFKTWGVTGFTVQGWDGSAWITLATVSGNNLVKRTVSFAAYTTDRIRVNITSALAGYSRITEIEAWGVAASGAAPDTTLPTVPTGLSATPVSSGQINLGWTASTDNVGVTGYKVYRGGALVGSPATASYNDTGLTASTSYSYTLSACDAANNCSAQSNPVSATTMSVTTSSNIALASVGAVASASSTYASGNPVGAVNDNERSGVNWDNGGGWADATANTQPDWVKINFNGTKTIDRVVVYTLQDNYTNPIEPTDTLTFKTWGVTGFTVQGWDGSAWVTLATVSGNNLVKRTVSFAAYTTDRIRVNITSALAGYSRITEIEAWGN